MLEAVVVCHLVRAERTGQEKRIESADGSVVTVHTEENGKACLGWVGWGGAWHGNQCVCMGLRHVRLCDACCHERAKHSRASG